MSGSVSDADGWERVAAVADIVDGQPFGAQFNGRDIVLARHEGQLYALAGICPHAYALMCDGFLNGAEIECPLHAAAFSLATGKCLVGPAGTGDLATFEVRTEGGDVFVRRRASDV